MSRSEDYLDNLLTSVTDKLSEYDEDFEQNRESLRESYQTQNDLPAKTQSALDEIREENFLREFEDELHKDGSDDSFLRDFERELNGETEDASGRTGGGLAGTGDMTQLDDELENLFRDDTGSTQSSASDNGRNSSSGNDADNGFDSGFGNGLDGFDSSSGGGPDGFGSSPGNGLDSFDSSFGSGLDGFDSSPGNGLDGFDSSPGDGPHSGSGSSSGSGYDNSLNDSFEGFDTVLNDSPDSSQSDHPDSDPDRTQALTTDEGTDTGEEGFSTMAKEQDKAPEGMEGLEDIFGDLFDEETASLLEELGADGTQTEPDSATAGAVQPDDSLTQILNESDDDALSELSQMLDPGTDSSTDQDTIPMGPDFSYEESAIPADDQDKKKKRKEKNPNSPFAKISRMLFGTPEELDPEAAAEIKAARAAIDKNEEQAAQERKEKKKQEKELKKQQKQEEAEKKKQEKEAAKAEKAAKKASKPKKEKKPKSKVPKEPPLPKVPVTMMWIIALSMMVLVFLGTVMLGYSVPVSESKEAFDNGDYVTAYAKLGGVKIKPEDETLYNASAALAAVQTELEAYTALMEQQQYEMALDALIRGYGRCAIHSAEAEEWGVADQLTAMEDKLDQLLKEQFNVSKRKAKKLYAIKKRSDYTLELHTILEKLGLME